MVIAHTTQGDVEGIERPGLLNFRGIPFAQPPVGPLRFVAPQPPLPWQGVREATQYGPQSLQRPLAAASYLPPPPERPMSEDCLYLNVWTPAFEGSRPVIVWIHGGAFVTGAGADFSGRELAKRDAVVVTINYRLGAPGFLALPALADVEGRFTNFGLRDQVAALRWVQENIAAFGGDPASVTIAGESAGAMSVGALMACPEARGLFHRAIAQSGAGHQVVPLATASAAAARFCELLEVRPDDADALRAVDAGQLLDASWRCDDELAWLPTRARRPWQPVWGPVIDGQCLEALPVETVRAASGPAVPLLVGSNLNEYSEASFGGESLAEDEVVARFAEYGAGEAGYRAYVEARSARGEPAGANDAWCAAATDILFRVPADRLAEANRGRGAPTYAYLFDWQSPALDGALGATHGLDVFFMSGVHTLVPDFAGSGPAADALAGTMMDAWSAFARAGDPSTDALHWPPFDPTERELMVLGERCRAVTRWHEEERCVWEGIIP